MKHRILAIVALLCAVGVFIAPSAIADDLTDVGTIAQSAIASLPAFVSANRQLTGIASQMQQQEAAQMKNAKNDAQRQQIQLEFSQRFNDKQNEILGPLLQRVQLALAAVSAKRKLAVVVDRHIVVYGGQDITTDVLNLVTGTQAIPPVTATPPPSPIGYVDQSVLDNGLPRVKAANDAFAKYAQQQRAIYAAKMQKATTSAEKQQISVEFNKVLADEQNTLLKPLVSKVRAITATIAEKKHLLVVVDKGDIVFGGTDITQDVRNGLNH